MTTVPLLWKCTDEGNHSKGVKAITTLVPRLRILCGDAIADVEKRWGDRPTWLGLRLSCLYTATSMCGLLTIYSWIINLNDVVTSTLLEVNDS